MQLSQTTLLTYNPKDYFASTNESNDVDIENMTMADYNLYNDDSKKDQEEDGDDEDTFDMCDITVEDVERIRKFFNVPDEIDEIVQPVIPEPIHTTLPNDDYVAPTTKLILDEPLEEFDDEILNVAMIDDEADFNPTKDLEEHERLLAMRPQSNFTEIQVDRDIISLGRSLTTRGWNSRSHGLVLCGQLVAELQRLRRNSYSYGVINVVTA
ncbi:hypothetical protein Tco_1548956 [Tanacetum coccineum]